MFVKDEVKVVICADGADAGVVHFDKLQSELIRRNRDFGSIELRDSSHAEINLFSVSVACVGRCQLSTSVEFYRLL